MCDTGYYAIVTADFSGIRCMPDCSVYPNAITDEVNEVCVCDESNFYFGNYDSCLLDCITMTGDIFSETIDN